MHLVGFSIRINVSSLSKSSTVTYSGVYVTLKERKRSLSGKNDHDAFWHYRNSYNTKLCVVAVFKQPQRFVA